MDIAEAEGVPYYLFVSPNTTVLESVTGQFAAYSEAGAFFFKQWGGVRKSKNGRKLDGRTYDEMPIEQVIPQMIESHDDPLKVFA
jgi:hypothetical protein